MTTSLVLLAAGSGKRMGADKAFLKLLNKTLLQWSLDTAQGLEEVHEVIVVASESNRDQIEAALSDYQELSARVVLGGAERVESVRNGVNTCSGDIVLVHNVANPMASLQDFRSLLSVLEEKDCAGFVGQPVTDTLRRIQKDHSETIDRKWLWRAQTPQGFRTSTLLKLLDGLSGSSITDEVSLYEDSGHEVVPLNCSPINHKVTLPEDIAFLERCMSHEVLVGVGEDSHRFSEEGDLVIGGILVPEHPKLKANSDGDLILHALFNAISSALGMGSISQTADKMCSEGIVNSAEYLKVILGLMTKLGFHINNVSISLECRRPKVDPLVPRIKDVLSKLFDIDEHRIGITATSGEKMTAFGKGEGIHCVAVVSLRRVGIS